MRYWHCCQHPWLTLGDAVKRFTQIATSLAGTVVLQRPLSSTVALYALPLGIPVTTAPAIRPVAVPVMVRSLRFLVLSSSPDTVSMVSTGAVKFTSRYRSLLLLPALSVSAVMVPIARGQLP